MKPAESSARRPQNGFTLIELMIATAIFGVIGLMIVNTFRSQSRFRADSDVQAETHQGANVALETLTRDIRLAGACLPTQPAFVPFAAVNGTRTDPQGVVQKNDTVTIRTGAVTGATTCPQTTLTANAATNSPTFSVADLRGFAVGALAFLIGPNSQPNGEFITITGTTAGVGCPSATPNCGTLTTTSAHVQYPFATSGIYGLEERVFTIDTTNYPTPLNPVPTLVRNLNRAGNLPVAAGIESLDIQYRLNTACPGLGCAGTCVQPGQPGDQFDLRQARGYSNLADGDSGRRNGIGPIDYSSHLGRYISRAGDFEHSAAQPARFSLGLMGRTVNKHLSSERGIGLITVLLTMGIVLALATALSVRMQLDTRGQASFRTTPQNLSVAEAGIAQGNAQFRNIFVNGNIPVGTTGNPPTTDGTGDYALQSSALGGKAIRYELTVPPGVTNPTSVRLPPGTQFGGLNVAQSLYTVISGTPDLINPTAQLRSEFQVNDIPTFQFLAFYNGRLDITPAEDMTVHGRIHSNGDLFLNSSGNTLTIDAAAPNIPAVEVSAVGRIYHRRAENTSCDGTVRILSNSTGALANLPCGQASAATIASYGGTLTANLQNIGLPPGYNTARGAASGYWPKADLRIVLDLTNKNFNGTRGATAVNLYPIVVQNADGSVNAAKTTALRNFMRASPGSIFYNDVPVTTDNGATLCTTQATATTYVNPTHAPPSCGTGTVTTNIANPLRYNPTFQGSNWVYRRVDKNSGANNRSVNWVLGTGATNDQLVNNGGALTTIGDYRRGGFYNNRENKWQYVLNVDLQDLLTWNIANGNQLFDPTDNSDGGTVIFLSVAGPIAGGINNYGARILDSPVLPGYPLNVQNPLGITLVSDQQMYVQGNYNIGPYAPTSAGPTGIPWIHPAAAVVGDTMNVLSQNWENPVNAYANDQKSATDLNSGTHGRVPSATTINAAFAAGVDDPAQSTNNYAGGLHNYPRTHEDWELPASQANRTLTYRGSFVSLTTPLHANGEWDANGTDDNMYTVPERNWDFDAQFNDLAMLPPMTPTFVYVNQIVIAEDFR